MSQLIGQVYIRQLFKGLGVGMMLRVPNPRCAFTVERTHGLVPRLRAACPNCLVIVTRKENTHGQTDETSFHMMNAP